jgi:preprotein translocase subunit YajC
MFSYFLNEAAGGAATGAMGGMSTIIMLVVIFVAMYFIVIRPQKKQEKEKAQMLNNLQVGDEITTIGGIIGKVISIKEETCMIETGKDKTRIRILKSAVSRVDVRAEDSIG